METVKAEHEKQVVIDIMVNGAPVPVHHKELSGLDIKEAAIKAGLPIKLGFALFLEEKHHEEVEIADDEFVKVADGDRFVAAKPTKSFDIKVNNKPVPVMSHHMTGLEIKQAAISAGLNVQVDFLLFKEKEGHPQKQIGDNESVHVKKGDDFDCVSGDDNS